MGNVVRIVADLVHGADDRWRVELPSYEIVDGTIDYQAGKCEVLVPEEDIDQARGLPTVTRLRERYKGNPLWDRDRPALKVAKSR